MCLLALLLACFDEKKVCLFSYGQTGSGKTHTMTGSGTGMMRGIVPRAVEHILARVKHLEVRSFFVMMDEDSDC